MRTLLQQIFSPGMFTYGFMINAWISSGAIAIAAGLVGFFVNLRGAAFAAHAVPRSAFAGAAAGFLFGMSQLFGLVIGAVAVSLTLAALDRRERRGVATALVLVAALGLGDLFITLSNAYAPQVFALLFGQLVGVSSAETSQVLGLTALVVIVFAALYRPVLLSSVMPESAAARGMDVGRMEIAFVALVALTAALTVPVVGALLAFSLMVAPAGAASHLATSPARALLYSVVIALACVWASIAVAYDTNLPIGFVVTVLCTLVYAAARFTGPRRSLRMGASYQTR